MEGVKAFLGCVLVATAAYFLIIPFPQIGTVFRSGPAWMALAAALALAGALGGGLRLPLRGGGPLRVVRKIAGWALVSAGLFGFVSSLTYVEPLNWLALDGAEAKARGEHRELIVDFTARWCPKCKEFERVVLGNADVRHGLADVVLAKVDLSSDPDAAEGGTFEVMGETITLRGIPRILLFDSKGTLLHDWGGRSGAPPGEAEEMLDILEAVKATRTPAAP